MRQGPHAGHHVAEAVEGGGDRPAPRKARRIRPARARRRPSRAAGPESTPLRSIQVNNRQLRDIIADAWTAIHTINDAKEPDGAEQPFLFQNGGALVRIAGTGAHTRIEALGDTAVYGILARSANWHNVTEEAVTAAPPSRDTARDMLVNPDPGLPPLDSVVRTPTFGKDATLITAPGYHRTDALWMFRDDSLNLPEVPTEADTRTGRARQSVCWWTNCSWTSRSSGTRTAPMPLPQSFSPFCGA